MRQDEWATPMPGLRIRRRGPTAPTRVQLYGQRCSGTNFAASTLRMNLGEDVLTEQYGFKHWFVPRQTLIAPDTLVLVVVRDAFDWVRSLYRQPWHADPDLKAMSFSDFIRAPWISRWDDHCHGIDRDHPMYGTEMMHERRQEDGTRFANCIDKRTTKLRQWAALDTRAHNVALLSYELLTAETEAVVAELAAVMNVAAPSRFVASETYKGQGHRPFVASRYEPIDDADAAHIASWLDPQVEASFGLDATYRSLQPA